MIIDQTKNVYRRIIPLKMRKIIARLRNRDPSLWQEDDYEYYFHNLRPRLNSALDEGVMSECEGKELFLVLSKLFEKRGVENVVPEEVWIDACLAASMRRDVGDDKLSKMWENSTSLFSPNMILASQIHAHNILLGMGHFQLAGRIRRDAKVFARENNKFRKDHKVDTRRHVAAAALECGDYKTFELNFPFSVMGQRKRQFLSATACSLSGQCQSNSKVRRKNLARHESLDFADLINGKRVALVGPADTTSEQGDEIDSFDLVVRCNLITENFSWDIKRKGRRSDVSYLSVAHGEAYLKHFPKLPWDLKWLCFKGDYHVANAGDPLRSEKERLVRSRSFSTLNPILFIGHANGVPNIACDLLYFNPYELKIFGADMMLTKERHMGYHSYFDQEKLDDVTAFRYASAKAHDPGSNFSIMKMISKDPRIKLDRRLEEVLSLDVDEYYNELQRIYGTTHRAAIL